MGTIRRDRTLHPAWWALILVVAVVALVFACLAQFLNTFTPYVPVTLASDRSGLVMESGAKVKLRGVQVGQVKSVNSRPGDVALTLDLYPDQVKFIPANVQARIRATTAFGAKYVELIYPSNPSPDRLRAGATIMSQNVTTEANTVFQSLSDVLTKIDPNKLNGILSALSDAFRGQGPVIGQATTAANDVLLALNSRADTIRQDWQSLKGFSDTYGAAAKDIVSVLDSLSTTSSTITTNAGALDALLTSVIGLSHSGIDVIAPNAANLATAVNTLESTTALLMKYSPTYTCLLQAGKLFLDKGAYDVTGGADGKSVILDVAILLGDDPYKYPQNLPIVGAKGGPGGKPSCGSLPDVAANWPVRSLVTNTGWGTGLDWRPNPGIGFPGYANYLPTTRAVPEPPSIRNSGGPAPGPIPYPGAPPYGAQLYAPDGTPLYPGLPPAPPPGAPRDPGPTPGSEPFVVPVPAGMQPTPGPPPPVPAVPGP
ncbi:MCE family protein [Mycobacterium eburneum]|nr:MCE family protein [Mycobacterium eburneum]TDH52869.1 MCE family protein [Mycobacterium eburneum]